MRRKRDYHAGLPLWSLRGLRGLSRLGGQGLRQIWRCRWFKTGRIRFLSHLDVLRAFERSFRRAGLVLARSQGYHPHALLSFGPALAVGIESMSEYFDAVLAADAGRTDLLTRLNDVLPKGLAVSEAKMIDRPLPSLAAFINTASYHLRLSSAPPGIIEACGNLLELEHLNVHRTSAEGSVREIDLRPLLLDVDLSGIMRGELGLLALAGSSGSLRPGELIGLLPDVTLTRAVRTGLYRQQNGVLLEPLEGKPVDWKELTLALE